MFLAIKTAETCLIAMAILLVIERGIVPLLFCSCLFVPHLPGFGTWQYCAIWIFHARTDVFFIGAGER